MKDSDYITVFAPMVSKLNLSGNNLIIFALIHGFTKDGKHEFTGSIDYISKWTNISKQSVISILKSLTEYGFINKRVDIINGVKFCSYTTNYEDLITSQKTLPPIKKAKKDSQKTLPNIDKEDKDTINNTPLPPNGKREKKGEIIIDDYVLPEFIETFTEWLQYKKQRKESYKTEKSIKLCYQKLVKLSDNNPEIARQIVEQSMANNWAGLFELKNENQYGISKKNYSRKQEANNYALQQFIEAGERIARGERVYTSDPNSKDNPF